MHATNSEQICFVVNVLQCAWISHLGTPSRHPSHIRVSVFSITTNQLSSTLIPQLRPLVERNVLFAYTGGEAKQPCQTEVAQH